MLTEKQIEARKNKLTASRIGVLITGNLEGIQRLYLEMIGALEPEDLSHVWAVQLGAVTEQLNLDWFEAKNRMLVTRRGDVVTHPDYPWGAATLDGWCENLNCPIEAKHTRGIEPLWPIVVDRYQPQMQFQMLMTDAEQCVMSVIMGVSEPVVEYIKRDQDFINEMLDRAAQFWYHYARGEPPVVGLNPVEPPADARRVYDMSKDNSWCDQA